MEDESKVEPEQEEVASEEQPQDEGSPAVAADLAAAELAADAATGVSQVASPEEQGNVEAQDVPPPLLEKEFVINTEMENTWRDYHEGCPLRKPLKEGKPDTGNRKCRAYSRLSVLCESRICPFLYWRQVW